MSVGEDLGYWGVSACPVGFQWTGLEAQGSQQWDEVVLFCVG